ncbi:MAG TPA: TonB-dependent receptor [Gemmatimonadaceae bacterium]|nr:TonB-dependent receptor [Gemmatimonadaceae bacterium]
MRRLVPAALGLLLAAGASSLAAQAPAGRPGAGPPPSGPGEVRGIAIAAESKAPVQRAAVGVHNVKDSLLVTGDFAKPDGSFIIRGLRPGEYYVRVTSMGFKPERKRFTITPQAVAANVDTLLLTQIPLELQAVEVKSDRPAMSIEPDRNTYRAKDVAPAATNASEVLDAVPSVQVDGDGKVSLRGNENVAIQINGRATPIQGTQLAAYLKSLPSNIIERIEVVPNPSAKHDPEGMAGIINIVLKQNVDLGVSAGLNLGIAETDRYNASGNVGYQVGKVSLLSSLGFFADDRPVLGFNDRERYDALAQLASITEQDIDGRQGGVGQNFTTTVDYKLTPKNVLTNALSINHRNFNDDQSILYTELDDTRAVTDRYFRPRVTDSKGLMFDWTTALKRTIEPRKHELSGEVRFNRARDEDGTSLWRQSTSTGAPQIENENDDTDALTRNLTGQLDYTRPLGKTLKLETGYKGNSRHLDRDFLVMKDDAGNGNWVRSSLSNDFVFDETVHAAYGVLSQSVGKKVQLQAGLRAERASRDFELSTTGVNYPYDYTSLFPSGVVMYNPSEATQLKVSYSRRIRRPGTQELNPFPSFFDAQNVFFGNPRLNPEYTDAYEVGISKNGKFGSLQLSPFYRRTTDIIRVNINTTDTVDTREVTSVSFENLANSNSWGTDLNGQLRLGPKFNGFASFNVFKMVTDGGSQSAVGSNAVTWSARLNATSQLTQTWSLQGAYFYRAPMKIERGRFSAFQGSNFTVRKKVNGDKAIVGFRVQDPFNTNRMRVRAGNDDVMQLTGRSFGVRSAWLTFQYNYGQTPRVREVRQEPSAENRTGFP